MMVDLIDIIRDAAINTAQEGKRGPFVFEETELQKLAAILSALSPAAPMLVDMGSGRRWMTPAPSQGWRPIETAPKDGTVILCYFPLEGLGPEWCRVVPVFFHRDRWTFASRAASGFSSGYEPTHWRPLPAPPKAGE